MKLWGVIGLVAVGGCAISSISEPTDIVDGCVKWSEDGTTFHMHGDMTVRFARGFLEVEASGVEVLSGRDGFGQPRAYPAPRVFLIPVRNLVSVTPGPECAGHPEHTD